MYKIWKLRRPLSGDAILRCLSNSESELMFRCQGGPLSRTAKSGAVSGDAFFEEHQCMT